MKSTLKVALFVCLFSTVTLADGEMGSGGKTCTGTCLVGTQPTEQTTKQTDSKDSILTFIQKYLISIFG